MSLYSDAAALKASLMKMRLIYPKEHSQRQQYEKIRNHSAPKKDSTYGVSGESKPGDESDFGRID